MMVVAVAIDLDALRDVTGTDERQHAVPFTDRDEDGIKHAVDACNQLREVAYEAGRVTPFAEPTGRRGLDQALNFADDGAEVVSERFDGIVDEGLLTRELLQRCVEIALAEFLDAGMAFFFTAIWPATMPLIPCAMVAKSPLNFSTGTNTSISPRSCSADIRFISAIRP